MRLSDDIGKIILYGAGNYGKAWIKRLGSDEIGGVLDGKAELLGTEIDGVPIIGIDQLERFGDDYHILISAAGNAFDQIYERLRQKGLEEKIVYSLYDCSVVRVMAQSRINAGDIFEGANYIGYGSTVYDSELGYASYVSDNVSFYNVRCGRYCSIAENVSILRGKHPSRYFVSTHPAFYSASNNVLAFSYVEETVFEEFEHLEDGYTTVIGNDVWIGKNVMIREGVTIGDGAIIGAGAVVVNDVDSYDVVGGVPAKQIRRRFEEDDIAFLTELKWWEKDQAWLKQNSRYFDDIHELRKKLSDTGNRE